MKIASLRNSGFTIIELIVCVVIIVILVAISVVAYAGISNKAVHSSLQSDLTLAADKLKLYHVDHGSYPTGLDGSNCPVPADSDFCLKVTEGNILTYTSISPYDTFTLEATNTATNIEYKITNNSVAEFVPPVPPIPTVTIGTQTWMKYNLNVGTKISGGTAQTDNGIVEKWCYSGLDSNCDTYGGMYQWDETMQYSVTEGAQGICPTGFHVPSDAEFKTLEIYLGMTPAQADLTNYRGTNQGTQLKVGGSSGWDGPFGGDVLNGIQARLDSTGRWHTSTADGTWNNWNRGLAAAQTGVMRWSYGQTYGVSVRCIQD